MSDDEKDLIVGRVVRQHAERQRDLAALLAKAKPLGENLSALGAALLGQKEWRVDANNNTVAVSERGHGGYSTITPLAWEEIVALLREITATRAEIRTLEQQRKELGV